MSRPPWILALTLLALAACSGSPAGTGGIPAQVVVTLLQPPAPPTTSVGFPNTLPRGASTLQVSALDSVGGSITLDAARYRFDVTPAAMPGFYLVTSSTNTTIGVTVLQPAASLPFTWRLTDITTSRIVVGPTVTNVLLQ